MSYKEPKNSAEFNAEFAKATLAIVYLTATWCGPCRAIAPIFAKAAGENPTITFFKVDVDVCSDLGICKACQGVPTFISYKNGTQVETFTGANQAALNNMIKNLH
ncbi:hypothetical protein ACTA71_008219 [Dictyostelium dimigraforme]